ncbi:hypothetical protein ACQKMK_17535 [Viridibacillus arvi]|uniref:hypothetical protein n=1 Tax=Viridibacillus arvi TaxID=263475 RepID=UPI003D089B70
MNIFTFDQIYNLVHAKAHSNSTNGVMDWYDFYKDPEEIEELIEKLPKNNTFKKDIQTAATVLQKDFEILSQDSYDDINEIRNKHLEIQDKLPNFLYKYIQ